MAQRRVARHQQAAIADTGDFTLLCEMLAEGGCPYCGELAIALVTPTPIQSICIQCGYCGWEFKQPQPIEAGGLRVITQAMLVELHLVSVLERRRAALRRQITAAIGAGVSITPGPLTVDVTEHSAQRVTWRKVAEHLGEDTVANLRARILSTTQRSLKVVPSYEQMMQTQYVRTQASLGSTADYIQ